MLDLLPILNVVLLLLVFFMMLARIGAAPAAPSAELPRADAGAAADPVAPLLRLDAQGVLHDGARALAAHELGQWRHSTGARRVRLQARHDAAAPNLLALLALLHAAGVEQVQLLVAPER